MLAAGGGQRCKIDVRGEVLLPGCVVDRVAQRVLTKSAYSAAMTPCELFFPRVSVVDEDEIAGLPAGCRHLANTLHAVLCEQGDIDSLAVFRMNRVVLHVVDDGICRWSKYLEKASAVHIDTNLATMIEYFDRQRVKEFVGEDDERVFDGYFFELRCDSHLAGSNLRRKQFC